jgi:kumamolisin
MSDTPIDNAGKTSAGAPDNYQRLTGSERRNGAHSNRVGPADPTALVTLTISVRRRPDGPPMPDRAYLEQTHPSERQYFSVEEFARLYGASPADLDAVAAFVTKAGMTVLEAHIGRRTVIASGSVAQVNHAFAIELHQYDSPLPRLRKAKSSEPSPGNEKPARQSHRGYEGHVHIPETLADIIVAVLGLE